MSKSQIEKLVEDEEGMRLFQQERLILSATERICEVMEEKGFNRKKLAEALGTTKSFVTQLLDGTRNMTLRTLSDVFLVLGYAIDIHTKELDESIHCPTELVLHLDVPSWSDNEPGRWTDNDSGMDMCDEPHENAVNEFEDIAA
jgi:transcriptional regulator with XRE-family HTH domain